MPKLLPLLVLTGALLNGEVPQAGQAGGRVAPCGRCLAAVLEPAQVGRLPAALHGLDVLVRVGAGNAKDAWEAVKAIRERGGRPGLMLQFLPADDLPLEGSDQLETIVIRIDDEADASLVAAAFDVKTRVTALRARLPQHVQIGVAAPDETVRRLLEADLSAYLDLVVSRSPPSVPVPWWREAAELTSVQEAMRRNDAAAARTLLTVAGEGEPLSMALADLSIAAQFMPPGLIPATNLRVSCAGRDADVWLDPSTLQRVAWVSGCVRDRIQIDPAPPVAPTIAALTTGDLLVGVAEASAERFAEGVEVRAARMLTVEEIVARHQAAAARQASKVRTRISTGTLTITFEAPGFPAPLTISSEAIIYGDRSRTDIEQRSIRVNGLEFGDGGIPRLPLIEPERVGSLPLVIELTDAYRYTLEGTDIVGVTPCYIVRFEPLAGERTLFRGKAWIAVDSFALVKVAATQVRLRGPIVSSEQVDEFARIEDDVWLLRVSRVNQIYEGAAHRTPIERVLAIDRHEVNPTDFIDRRAAAYASEHVMLRDTAEGYRYLKRSARSPTAGTGEPAGTILERAGQRVRTVAVGTIFDPNISHPLPFAGVSYLDFNLFGTGTQFSGFFGGTFGQAAFSVPSIAASRWQLAGRALAIASAFNDRAFLQGREQYDRNIRQRPAQASIWLLRPLSSRMSLRVGYDLEYTHYARTDSTSSTFIVPAAQVVHALRVAVEGQRKGWNAGAWWSPAVRQGWRPWGIPSNPEYEPGHRDFQRYGLSLARSVILTPTLAGRTEALWMGGHDLDRFSRYAFGAFENRLRGYPGALIRYDGGAVLRGAMAWAPGPRMRLDAFLDTAFVHDPGFGDGLRRFTGLGVAVEIPAPLGTLVAAEWGFGVQGYRTDGRRGTHVFRVTGYKIF